MEDIDFGKRDKRGNWKPNYKVTPNPKYIVPFEPLKLLKHIVGWNGYIFPWAFIWASVAVICWFFFTPPLEQMRNFELGWITYILVRNAIVVFLYAGFFHLHFFIQKSQGWNFKYNTKPLENNNSKFLFKNQTKDNLVYVFLSAIPIWTAYEVITYWLFANSFIPMIDWSLYPVYCAVLFFLVPTIRDIHFYLVHRFLHWPPLYKIGHKVHHNNTNPGPWSGLAMHPIEHTLYFTGIIFHWIIPSHPLIAMWHIFHAGLAPHAGHSGYDKMIFKNGKHLDIGAYDHYLHHKYFECNYGGGNFGWLDKWFGTLHDGSEEAHERTLQRIKNKSYL